MKIKSTINGTLEITMQQGRKVLHSRNTNYSYGNVQQVWRKGLQKADWHGVKNVLLLGLGGGSVVDILRNEMYFAGHITAVDIDPSIVQIANTEFGMVNSPTLSIKCEDAAHFVRKTRKKFDVVIVDIFIDCKIPKFLTDPTFWEHTAGRCPKNGRILFNAFHALSSVRPVIELLDTLGFNCKFHKRINGSNAILYAVKKNV